MNMKSKELLKCAKDALSLARVLNERVSRARFEFVDVIDKYEKFTDRLIETIGGDGDELQDVKAEAARLHELRLDVELDYAHDNVLETSTRRRSATAIAALLVALAALASVYTAGYVRGEIAAMEGTPPSGCISAKCTSCAVHGTAPTGKTAPCGRGMEVTR